ncbi:MAG: four helix bundle protein [Ignavibacteriaceae bacterium]
MNKSRFEKLEIYTLSEKFSDLIWQIAFKWDHFSRDTIGKQLVRSADSIGANIAEGSGKGSYSEFRRYLKISRGSLFETKHWLRRAFKRSLLIESEIKELQIILDELLPRLSAYINYIDKKIENEK